jgi:hypothetical protein
MDMNFENESSGGDGFSESKFLVNSCSNMRLNTNNNNNCALFSGENSANTSYMTLNENLYKPSFSSQNNTQKNNKTTTTKSLIFFKNIKNLQHKIQSDQLVF